MQRAIISPNATRARGIAVEIDPITSLEAVKGSLEVKLGIGQRRPARQRLAVLDSSRPAARLFLEAWVVAENPTQVMGVGAAIIFDELAALMICTISGSSLLRSKHSHGISSSVQEPIMRLRSVVLSSVSPNNRKTGSAPTKPINRSVGSTLTASF